MRTAVLRQAVRPTAAAMPWTPVVATATALVAIAGLVDLLSGRPGSLPVLGGAALASGAVATMRDPAETLLAPVPTPRLVRRLLRLALAALVVVPAVVALDGLTEGPVDIATTTFALALTGLAVATWLPEDGVLFATAVPVTWVVATELLGRYAGSLDVWAEQPWPLAAVAAAAVLAGRHR